MIIEKISARVFCQLQGGGNSVTMFVSSTALKGATASKLAATCDWESVMVNRNAGPVAAATSSGDASVQLASMSFYMPTGRSVSFCAHAAMGGLTALTSRKDEPLQFTTELGRHDAIVHDDDIVSLQMTSPYVETAVDARPLLHRVLREQVGVEAASLQQGGLGNFIHASVARPKTLVRLKTVEALHEARSPLDPVRFEAACEALEDTTGLYLFALGEKDATAEEVVMHARQFPRASGYSEDPATGIAAAALAAAWHRHDSRAIRYKIHQGEAMGQPSLLVVQDIKFRESRQENDPPSVSFGLLGRVEIDSKEDIHLEDDDSVNAAS